MKWVKLNYKKWVAQGKDGKFVIHKSGIFYIAKYFSDEIEFTLPWNRSIKELKKMCEENYYWE